MNSRCLPLSRSLCCLADFVGIVLNGPFLECLCRSFRPKTNCEHGSSRKMSVCVGRSRSLSVGRRGRIQQFWGIFRAIVHRGHSRPDPPQGGRFEAVSTLDMPKLATYPPWTLPRSARVSTVDIVPKTRCPPWTLPQRSAGRTTRSSCPRPRPRLCLGARVPVSMASGICPVADSRTARGCTGVPPGVYWGTPRGVLGVVLRVFWG